MPAKTTSSRKAPPHPEAGLDAASYHDLFHSLRGLAAQMQGISQLAVAQYTPVVESIILTRSRDGNHIEHTLDHLLDFCHSEQRTRQQILRCERHELGGLPFPSARRGTALFDGF